MRKCFGGSGDFNSNSILKELWFLWDNKITVPSTGVHNMKILVTRSFDISLFSLFVYLFQFLLALRFVFWLCLFGLGFAENLI